MTEYEGLPGFDGDSDDVVDMAVAEMGKRLRDAPTDLPAHVLIKLVAEANKTAERRALERERRAAETDQTNVLDVVRNSPLPPDRKQLLIRTEIKRLDSLRAELEAELDE